MEVSASFPLLQFQISLLSLHSRRICLLFGLLSLQTGLINENHLCNLTGHFSLLVQKIFMKSAVATLFSFCCVTHFNVQNNIQLFDKQASEKRMNALKSRINVVGNDVNASGSHVNVLKRYECLWKPC